MEGTNPATGATIEPYDEHDDGQVEDRRSRAESTFEPFRGWSVAEREATLAEVATVLRDRTTEHTGQYLQDEQHPSPPGATVETVWRQQPATDDDEVPTE